MRSFGRLIYRVAALCLTLPLLASAAEIPADMARILDRGEIVISMVAKDQPPFFMTGEDGRLEGLDVELAEAIGRDLGVKVIFDRGAQSFNETVERVLSGKADLAISKLSRTLSRAQRVRFTRPYVILHKGLLVNRLRMAQAGGNRDPDSFVKNLSADLGVIRDSSYVGYAKQMFPKAKVIEFDTWEDVTHAVADGTILAAFRDDLEIKKVVVRNPEGALTLQTIVFPDEMDPIAIAVAPTDTHLLAWLDLFLETRTHGYDADQLLDRYREKMFPRH